MYILYTYMVNTSLCTEPVLARNQTKGVVNLIYIRISVESTERIPEI